MDKSSVRADLIAGLTGMVVVLPQGVAFAIIAGLPPIYGLYTAIVTPIIAGLFGSSRHLISGPTTPISIVVFSAISPYAEAGTEHFVTLALTLTFLAGLYQFLFGLFRLGTLINFVSHTVVIGFTAGAALLIGISQMKHLFGVNLRTGPEFYATISNLVRQAPYYNYFALGIGMFTLIAAILIKKYYRNLPNLLIAMILGSILAVVIGGEARGIQFVAKLPSGLPPFRVPNMDLDWFRQLGGSAFAVALLGLIEAVAIGRAVGTKTGQRINGNQEFIGQGLSNLVGSFFSSYAASGSFTRTGVNYEAGARTPLAAVFASLSLALVVLFIAPLTSYLPMPVLGGIILLVAYNLIDFKAIKKIVQTSRLELTVLIVTFSATLIVDLEYAIYIGVIVSLIFYLKRTSKPNITLMAPDPGSPAHRMINLERHVDVPLCPQLHIVRLDGSIYYGAVDHISAYFESLRKSGRRKNVLIVANGVNFVDLTGAEWLLSEAETWKKMGGGLYVTGLKIVAQDALEKSGIKDVIGRDHFFNNKTFAISSIYDRLNPSICVQCTAKIFFECHEGLPGGHD
jgi:sulfate permease, SulP family